MAHWKFTLDISKIWNDKEMSVQDKGKAIAEEIKKTVPEEWITGRYPNAKELDSELCNIIQWLSDMDSYVGHSIVSEFDGIMECLYEWADQTIEPLGVYPRHAMCWIKTQNHM